jgi:hypothetical protein
MAVAFPGATSLEEGGSEFDSWLSSRLKSFNTDDSVLVPYVKGILESEEEDDGEKNEALLGILCEISVSSAEANDCYRQVIFSPLRIHPEQSRSCELIQNATLLLFFVPTRKITWRTSARRS